MLELYNIVYVVSGPPASPIVNWQKQLAVETESQIESCHAHPSVGSSRSRPCDVVDGRDDRRRRQPRSRLRPPSGRSEPCASRPPSSRSGCASAWTRSFRRCCASTASTCGSCRCASTTRTRCSRRSRRPRPSPRGGARSTFSSTSARRPARRPRPACVERIALGGTSQGGVFEARRSTKAAAGNVGRGQQAELWGDEQWQALKHRHRGAQPQGHRHRSLDRIRVLRRPLERRAPRHERRARRQVDDAFPQRRGIAAGTHRRAPAGGRSVLQADAGARLVDDADDVLVARHHAGQDANERSRVVVAPARQRPRSRHVVPAERRRAAQGRERRAARRRSGHRARAISSTATSASPWRGSTPTRSTTPTCFARGRPTPPAGLRQALANANALQDIVVDEIRPGRTGNEILAAARARMKAQGDRRDGLLASDRPATATAPVPLIGLWDYQDGVPGTRRRAGHRRACGSRSSCRRRRRCPSGADSASGWRRKRTSSSTPTARFAGR